MTKASKPIGLFVGSEFAYRRGPGFYDGQKKCALCKEHAPFKIVSREELDKPVEPPKVRFFWVMEKWEHTLQDDSLYCDYDYKWLLCENCLKEQIEKGKVKEKE